MAAGSQPLVPNGGDSGQPRQAALETQLAAVEAQLHDYAELIDHYREMAARFAVSRDELKHRNRTIEAQLHDYAELLGKKELRFTPQTEDWPQNIIDHYREMAARFAVSRDELKHRNRTIEAQLYHEQAELETLKAQHDKSQAQDAAGSNARFLLNRTIERHLQRASDLRQLREAIRDVELMPAADRALVVMLSDDR